jgi:histidine ammonia-lyase
MFELYLKPGELSLADMRLVYNGPVNLSIGDDSRAAMDKSVAAINAIIEEGKTVYGINTGFGKLAKEAISEDKLEELQKNLVISHAAGTGDYLDDNIVRLMMVLKINALTQGYSGIRPQVVDALATLVNEGIYPCIPGKGSVGASGDLAPLAHMSAVLLGYGEARYRGEIISAKEGMKKAGLDIVTLGPKEGLALLNGTQLSTALALAGLFGTEDVFAAALVAGALSTDAAKGSPAPFRSNLQQLRRQPGQIRVAAEFRALLEGSEIRESHKDCDRVQDPYCLRCMPQVMGPCLDHIDFVAAVLEREANAVTDNPLVFPDSGEILSGGNFHAEPVAMAADTLALAIAEIGNMSERRIAMLLDDNISGLPPFLVEGSGLNSGFMVAHVTAAALASENKQMSFPACVDSIPTSANQEDHVSMATHGARRLMEMTDNVATIVAIEIMSAVQGVEFHRPLKSSKRLEEVITRFREVVLPYTEDRYFAPDIEAARKFILSGDVKDVAA